MRLRCPSGPVGRRSSGTGLLLAAALLCACAPGDTALERVTDPETDLLLAANGHTGLVCADCHLGSVPPERARSLPLASRDGCTASGCHTDGGPFTVSTASGTVPFAHRDHPTPWEAPLECASCHAHDSGAERLEASSDGCALCHTEALSGDSPRACRVCHQRPPATAFTSQGVAVPHGGTTWLETGCVRCHFEVVDEAPRPPTGTCGACHTRAQAARLDFDLVDGYGDGRDLHPDHDVMACASCHAEPSHAVLGTSTAVTFVCAQCHVSAHEIEEPDFPSNATCLVCHDTDHAEAQRLFTGLVEDGALPTPSVKFMAGLTCTSCHRESDADAATYVATCTLCHGPEYGEILAWWERGATQRTDAADAYLAAAETALPDDPAVRRALTRARARVDLAELGGVYHSVEVSHALLRAAIEDVGEAHALAERTSPDPPDLGARPRAGFCTYCHYDLAQELPLGSMPEDFHRDVVGR